MKPLLRELKAMLERARREQNAYNKQVQIESTIERINTALQQSSEPEQPDKRMPGSGQHPPQG